MVDDKAYIYSVDYYDVENMQLILRYLGHDYDLKSAKAQLDIGRKYL